MAPRRSGGQSWRLRAALVREFRRLAKATPFEVLADIKLGLARYALVASAQPLAPGRAATLGAGLAGLIGACVSEHEAKTGDSSAPGEPTLARVLRHIERHATDPMLDARHLCDAFHLSRAALYRLLKAHGGVAELIRRRRAEVARRLLGDGTRRRVEAAARDSGFFDTRTLHRALRDLYGASPSELRRSALDPEAAASEHRLKVGALLDGSGE